MSSLRRHTRLDQWIDQLDQAARTLFAAPRPERDCPGTDRSEPQWDEASRRHAAGLMRINHTGEVCAQALYNGQSLFARNPEVRAQLVYAAREEGDHLAWCQQRLEELDDRPSFLNPLWYLGSFTIGVVAALIADAVSLGFVAETERQVEAHLHDHLERLPAGDERSRAIVRQMAADEARHGREAMSAGGEPLPEGIATAMSMAAGVMKLVVYRY